MGGMVDRDQSGLTPTPARSFQLISGSQLAKTVVDGGVKKPYWVSVGGGFWFPADGGF